MDALIASYAPELKPRIHRRDFGVVAGAAGLIFVLIPLMLLLGGTLSPLNALLSSVGGFTLWAAGNEMLSRLEYRSRIRNYERRVRFRPDILYGQVADKFKQEITDYRTRMLGPQSDLHRARDPLKVAQDEADRSVAYWGARLRQDRSNEVAHASLETAEDLSLKFTRALEELDRRSDALLLFLNECYAKLAVLEGSRTDFAESKRLAALSDQADVVVDDAESALDRIGEDFLTEAARLGGALGALRALHLKELAGEVPLDQIENVADRILEAYQEDSETLQKLVESMTRSGPQSDDP